MPIVLGLARIGLSMEVDWSEKRITVFRIRHRREAYRREG